jgi:hypothetical protein
VARELWSVAASVVTRRPLPLGVAAMELAWAPDLVFTQPNLGAWPKG